MARVSLAELSNSFGSGAGHMQKGREIMPQMNSTGQLAQCARVLIVDDHPVVRCGLATLFSGEPDFDVTSQCESDTEAMMRVEADKPDLVLVDVSLHGRNDLMGIELVKQIHSRFPSIRVLVLSMHDEFLYAERALQAGAMGYIMKEEPPSTLLAAARQILRGEVYVSTRVAARILRKSVGENDRPSARVEDVLTNRELEIFKLIGRGLSTQKIARQLFLSTRTVDTHRQRLKEKLGLPSSQDLSEHATDWLISRISENLLANRRDDE